MEGADAVVIGAGPNGLVCANLLADAGWDVIVLEASPSPGGAVSSAGYLGDGFVADVGSAFYPLAARSPVIAGLHLEEHGLRWCRSPAVLAHPLPGRRAAVLWPDLERTAAGVEGSGAGDGEAWKRLYGLWKRVEPGTVRALFGPFPPLLAAARLARDLGPAGLARFARFALLPVRRLAEEELAGEAAALLLAGCALHTDLFPEAATSAAFGWLLAMLGQDLGFPVPEGGAGRLSEAMARRLEARGGRILCGHPVRSVTVRRGRAVGAVDAGGVEYRARRAVMADVAATSLYGGLVGWDDLPVGLRRDMARFQWDHATVKLDWALDGPIPWASPEVGQAATVHVADGVDEMTQYCADLARRRVPARPFLVLGQMGAADPSRCPPGTEVGWAYTHVPLRVGGDAGGEGISGRWDSSDRRAITERVEARIEEHAPGFRSLIRRRHLMCPPDLEARDANLVGGALNGGTASLHQQLLFRPTPGLGRAETPVPALYLASASAHPGGGVHGACGANAARAALAGSDTATWVRNPAGWAARRLLGGD